MTIPSTPCAPSRRSLAMSLLLVWLDRRQKIVGVAGIRRAGTQNLATVF
ncbi:hypothetical protein XOC_3414 [Xanthomonas oryzae pv. oryzicola BLS256]|uniref:Uncharacterized protein n=1 Tax=Xanthomonas oryzae pv. oryzicola (strain BLS256) TaxID=383407 RepID=G7TCZ1_XANOB|nr:hypothetical protein XOC_3414 [Xanthomonas oryzae pv. oryzicola BLS256]QEO96352.1 hypothetical protein XOCgx_1359 [Xanthomonas oryzae pv. oryzicola]